MKKKIIDNLKTIFFALIIALFIRSFFFQPFYIPSSSMEPSLLIGDRLFVSKYTYGYSRHSLPFSPNFSNNRIFIKKPERGDVVVFKTPEDNRTDYIKRVIGLPGDKIQIMNGVVFLNNEALPKLQIDNFIEENYIGKKINISQYEEALFNKVYKTLDLVNNGVADNTNLYVVPENHFFVMGDNRDNSQDSRFKNLGFIPVDNLVGKAWLIFFSLENSRFFEIWKWPNAIRFSRIFSSIE